MAVNVTIGSTPEITPQNTGVDVGITDPPKIKVTIPDPNLYEVKFKLNIREAHNGDLMIFDHPVWGKRRDIQRALALNPRSPLAIRCSLTFALSQEDCEHILREKQVPLPLKVSLRKQRASLDIDGQL